MEIIHSIETAQEICFNMKKKGAKIAFVPTMGALHHGHLSLIKKAKEYGDIVITSIFVNPTQFAPNEDFDAYPRNMNKDAALAEKAGCDMIFAPKQSEMYPTHFHTKISIGNITSKFEGAQRPTHFDGVALIVAKLFHAVTADYAIFGQKDYQQTLVIKQMVRDLNMPIKIIVSPTIREENGLAMSSRNEYLSLNNRKRASIIYRALLAGKMLIEKGECEAKNINSHIRQTLNQLPDIHIQYVATAYADNLEEPQRFLPGEHVVMLIAAYIGETRLIDNIIVAVPFPEGNSSFIAG